MSKPKPNLRISLLSTGNEVLTGDITDTNSIFLTKQLSEIGLPIEQKRVVGDNLDSLVKAIRELSGESDVLIVNGGLGSTVDDLTSEAVAVAAQTQLIENAVAKKHMEDRFGQKVLEENPKYHQQLLKQTLLPEGAGILDNPVGIALGYKIIINNALCYFTPGVPREMKVMMEQSIVPDIQKSFSLPPSLKVKKFRIFGIGESQVQQRIHEIIPDSEFLGVHLGFRASSPFVEVKLAVDDVDALPQLETIEKRVEEILTSHIISRGSSMPETMIELLVKHHKSLSLAESCTGGTVASQLTAIPGASQILEAGLITYSNRSKTDLLNIPSDLIENEGAVSQAVAEKMVEGTLAVTGSDYSISITGIAGPSGGTDDKPVGTVFIGWGDKNAVFSRKLLIRRERLIFQLIVSSVALDLLRRYILDLPMDIPYFFDDYTRAELFKSTEERA